MRRLTLDVAQLGGKSMVCHENGTQCRDMCCLSHHQLQVKSGGGGRLTVQTCHTSFLFIILPFTLLTFSFAYLVHRLLMFRRGRGRDGINRLIPICPPAINLYSHPLPLAIRKWKETGDGTRGTYVDAMPFLFPCFSLAVPKLPPPFILQRFIHLPPTLPHFLPLLPPLLHILLHITRYESQTDRPRYDP